MPMPLLLPKPLPVPSFAYAFALGIIVGAATVPESRAQSATVRPSFDLTVPVPPTPVRVAGTSRLIYELRLAVFASVPLIPRSIEVVDVEDGSVIADVRGDDLARRLRVPGQPIDHARPPAIAPGMLGVLYLELSLSEDQMPGELEHRVTFHALGDDANPPPVVTGARVPVDGEPPVILGPPLRGGPWTAVYDPSWERGHRRVVYAVDGRARIPGRFAVDWILLDEHGHLARGDDDVIDNWYGYGADVLAVADGVVVAARDDMPESATVSGHPSHPLEDATGNYIALDIGGGRFAFYEHLKSGSVRVNVGERVRRGQVIGAVGFTGHSTGPHLHFHVSDTNSPLGAEGVPFVLERFDVLGRYDDFSAFGNAPWTPIDSASESPRREEFPAPNVVVDFGDGRQQRSTPDVPST